MNMTQKRAALAKITPTVAVETNSDPLVHRAISSVAGSIGVIPSYTLGFFADIGASFQYEEAKRKGQLETAPKTKKSGLL